MGIWYTTDFEGFWPVGCAAIVYASTERGARQEMWNAIVRAGLGDQNKDQRDTLKMTRLDTTRPNAVILNNEDY